MATEVSGSAERLIRRKVRAIEREYVVAMQVVGDELEFDHLEVVRRWQHKPKFTQVLTITPRFMRVRLGAEGQHRKIWLYVDRGTKPHLIPKFVVPGAKPLRFRRNYSARTQPVGRYNVGTGTSSGGWVTIKDKQVQHPGTKARRFGRKFARDILPLFVTEIRRAIRRGASV